jgi:hypothetical protein
VIRKKPKASGGLGGVRAQGHPHIQGRVLNAPKPGSTGAVGRFRPVVKEE